MHHAESRIRDVKPMTVTVYLDESGTQGGSSRILVGAIATMNKLELDRLVNDRKKQVLADRSTWADQDEEDRARLKNIGFHHAEDSDTVRGKFIETIEGLEFRAHVCYSGREIDLPDIDLMICMYYSVVQNIVRRYANLDVHFVFEENSSLNRHYGAIVDAAVRNLDQRTPSTPRANTTAEIGAKPLPGLSVIDYTLALTEMYLKVRDGDKTIAPFQKVRISSIESQIAHIIDFDRAKHRRRFSDLF